MHSTPGPEESCYSGTALVEKGDTWPVPFLSQIPVPGPILFDHNFLVYIGFLLVPL